MALPTGRRAGGLAGAAGMVGGEMLDLMGENKVLDAAGIARATAVENRRTDLGILL